MNYFLTTIEGKAYCPDTIHIRSKRYQVITVRPSRHTNPLRLKWRHAAGMWNRHTQKRTLYSDAV